MSVFALSRRTLIVAATVLAGLSGCATVSQPVSVADTIARTPSLSTLNSLVSKPDLQKRLKARAHSPCLRPATTHLSLCQPKPWTNWPPTLKNSRPY